MRGEQRYGFDALREVVLGALQLLGIRRLEEDAQQAEEILTEWGDGVLADFLAGETDPLDPDKL